MNIECLLSIDTLRFLNSQVLNCFGRRMVINWVNFIIVHIVYLRICSSAYLVLRKTRIGSELSKEWWWVSDLVIYLCFVSKDKVVHRCSTLDFIFNDGANLVFIYFLGDSETFWIASQIDGLVIIPYNIFITGCWAPRYRQDFKCFVMKHVRLLWTHSGKTVSVVEM